MGSQHAPPSILIIGSGAFGLSTAWALTKRARYDGTKITVLDRSVFPPADGSSIDSSRIVRADYSTLPYAQLASAAQARWRSIPGLKDHYSEAGFVVACSSSEEGENYVRDSYSNVRSIYANDPDAIVELPNGTAIAEAVGTGGTCGDWAYLNRRSGWANAEGAMCWLRREVEETGRVTFIHAQAAALLREQNGSDPTTVTGARLSNGEEILASLVILATGAWSGRLLDLRGRATATGQCLAYVTLTDEEQARLKDMPVWDNFSSGFYILPPKNNVLKIARHAYGYANPVSIPHPSKDENSGEEIEISVPLTTYDQPGLGIPHEGQSACRAALAEMIPFLADRPFSRTRLCWYNDTPSGDFLITRHPELQGLFVATGGSGHGFKFMPVIGDAIVDVLEGKEGILTDLWRWPKGTEGNGIHITADGSRAGKVGLILKEELARST